MPILAALLALGATPRLESKPLDIYVSPSGSDSDLGTAARPLATLEAARDRARSTSAKRIVLRAGTYRLGRSFTLDAKNSGLSIVAFRGERPLISGGRRIPPSAVHPCREPSVLARLLDPLAARQVLEVDLDKCGLKELSPFTPYGFPRPIAPAPNTLYAGGEMMAAARWPNTGFAHVKKVSEPGNGEGEQDRPKRRPVFTADSDRPKQWKNASEVWLYGYWKFDWADESIRLAGVDASSGEITLESPHVYGVDAGTPFFAENLLEELDAPGEYYVDREKRTLYFIPKDRASLDDLVLSELGEPLLAVRGAKGVTIRGIDFAYGRGDGIRIQDSENVRIEACELYDLGERAVTVEGGQACGIRSSNIWNTGEGGITLSGGDRKTLTPSRHFVENCDIHHYQRRTQTYRPAVSIAGVGQRVSHCAMHDAPHSAIIFGGNDHLIEGNEFFRTISRTGDGGVVYTGRDWTARGTQILDNDFHDNIGIRKWEPAIYLDDLASGIVARGNSIRNCHWAFLIGGGRDNVIEENTIVDCALAFRADARGLGWAAKSRPTMMERLNAVPYQSEPWRSRYPALVDILAEDPMAPRANVLRGNVLIRSGKVMDQTEAGFVKTALYERNQEGTAPRKPARQAGLRRDSLRATLPKRSIQD
jgi:hypothetical protein